MKYNIRSMTEIDANNISKWKYDYPYDAYNISCWNTEDKCNIELLRKTISRKEFFVVEIDNCIIGFIKIINSANSINIGLGLCPYKCGHGFGKFFLDIVIEFAKSLYGNKAIELDVRSFNIRAIKCYKSKGFIIVKEYTKDILGEKINFILMRKE